MNRRQALLSIAALPAVAAGVAVAGKCDPPILAVGIVGDQPQSIRVLDREMTHLGDGLHVLHLTAEDMNCKGLTISVCGTAGQARVWLSQ
jgi:hypothetical protein